MGKDEAILKIIGLAKQINPDVNENNLEFYATKLVLDVLDYCNRDDFPEALCYALAGALVNQFTVAADDLPQGAPLKKIRQDDTEFEFAVSEKDMTVDASTQIFDALKPRLNLYRKVKAL